MKQTTILAFLLGILIFTGHSRISVGEHCLGSNCPGSKSAPPPGNTLLPKKGGNSSGAGGNGGTGPSPSPVARAVSTDEKTSAASEETHDFCWNQIKMKAENDPFLNRLREEKDFSKLPPNEKAARYIQESGGDSGPITQYTALGIDSRVSLDERIQKGFDLLERSNDQGRKSTPDEKDRAKKWLSCLKREECFEKEGRTANCEAEDATTCDAQTGRIFKVLMKERPKDGISSSLKRLSFFLDEFMVAEFAVQGSYKSPSDTGAILLGGLQPSQSRHPGVKAAWESFTEIPNFDTNADARVKHFSAFASAWDNAGHSPRLEPIAGKFKRWLGCMGSVTEPEI